jgi:hypothetical protein
MSTGHGFTFQSMGIPEALAPLYTVPDASVPVLLYQGPLEITQAGLTDRGDGTLRYQWLPSPRITFELPLTQGQVLSTAPASLRLPPSGAAANVFITRLSFGAGHGISVPSASGIVQQPFVQLTSPDAHVAVFHLANFCHYIGLPIGSPATGTSWIGRATLEADGWRVTIDQLENYSNLRDILKRQSGYAVTHVGRLERVDGQPFPKIGADDLWQLLFYFFSFTRGFYSAPILPVGLDNNGHRVWEEWRDWMTTPFTNVYSWFEGLRAEALADAFPGFVRRYQNADWAEVVRTAIDWYVVSNLCTAHIEGSLILTQTALELLAWAILVEEHNRFPRAQFDNPAMNARERITKLLNHCGIPTSVPAHLAALNALAAARAWTDGPQAIVCLRNSIVHPEIRNRRRLTNAPPEVRSDAWRLGLWYLELVLLHWFGYIGEYVSRLQPGGQPSQPERVPWATP